MKARKKPELDSQEDTPRLPESNGHLTKYNPREETPADYRLNQRDQLSETQQIVWDACWVVAEILNGAVWADIIQNTGSSVRSMPLIADKFKATPVELFVAHVVRMTPETKQRLVDSCNRANNQVGKRIAEILDGNDDPDLATAFANIIDIIDQQTDTISVPSFTREFYEIENALSVMGINSNYLEEILSAVRQPFMMPR